MSLDIGSGSGRPYVKYNSKAGRWYIRGESDDVEIQPPTFIIDFDNIVSGWFLFREGQAPDRALDPGNGHSRSSSRRRITSAVSSSCATASSSSAARSKCPARRCIFAMPSKTPTRLMKPASGANIGKVPVFVCTGITPSRDKFGQNFKPTLQLIKWVDRPAELPDEPAAMDRPQPAPRPAAAARPSPPPRAPAVADLATASSETMGRELFTQLPAHSQVDPMPAEDMQPPVPDQVAMRRHVEHLFLDRCMAWSNWPGLIRMTARRGTPICLRLDRLDELVEKAAALNGERRNTYVGAALRKREYTSIRPFQRRGLSCGDRTLGRSGRSWRDRARQPKSTSELRRAADAGCRHRHHAAPARAAAGGASTSPTPMQRTSGPCSARCKRRSRATLRSSIRPGSCASADRSPGR